MRKLDRRIRRTRRLLGEALISLALEFDYDEISIRRLTQRADVGYATFYRHFKSKDELFIDTLISKWNEFKQSLEPGMTGQEEAVALFRFIDREREAHLAGLSIPRDHPVIKAVHESIAQDLAARYQAPTGCVIPFNLTVTHLLNAGYDVIRWYLEDENAYTPEQMAVIYNQLILETTQDVAIEPRRSLSLEDA